MPIFPFDLGEIAFAAAMAIRGGGAVWDGRPIIQGQWDTTGTPDVLVYPRGDKIGNPTDVATYANLDTHQGTISFTIVPEWDGGDGLRHQFTYNDVQLQVYKTTGDNLRLALSSGDLDVDISAWVAGTTYYIAISWDAENMIDGTNYARISINDAHTYGIATKPTAGEPDGNQHVGSTTLDAYGADAIVGGFRVDDMVWWDGVRGDYGQSMGVDLVALHAAGTDIAAVIASYGLKLGLPTDATPGVLPTTGQACSHPLGILDQQDLWDGGVFGTPYAVEFASGDDTIVNCGSGATLDDIPDGDQITVSAWVRRDVDGESGTIIQKWVDGNGWVLWGTDTGQLSFYLECATTDAFAASSGDFLPIDGKWHYVVGFYDDTAIGAARVPQVSVDGVWETAYATQIAGVGAYQTDAALDLTIGARPGPTVILNGAITWAAIWDDDHHVAGTDFIAPIAYPAPGGNLVECWPANAGTGAVLVATVTSPANDGTIANGSWSSVWQDSGSPVLSQCLKFEEENDGINFLSGVNIDDLFLADCTIELWLRVPPGIANYTGVISKSDAGWTVGWVLQHAAVTNQLQFAAQFANNDFQITFTVVEDDQWHHVAIDWDFGTLTGRVLVDGVYRTTDTAVGAYQVDAAQDCIVNGYNAVGTGDGDYGIGWIRLSNIRRYPGAGDCVVIPDRHNPPGNDANAHLLVPMTDGAGLQATDISGNAYHGTITFGATTRWINDQDIAQIAPGAQIFGNRGLVWGSDGANDGAVHEETVTALTDYVLRVVAHPGPDSRGKFQVRVRDATGAANIVTVEFPSMYGVHDGGNAVANLGDTTARWLNNQLGLDADVYNITDGSKADLGANPCSGDMQEITTALAGGVGNLWDNGDVYRIVFPVGGYKAHPMVLVFCFQTPAACTSLEVYVEETSGEGTLYLHRVEVLPNEVINGDFESLTGANPDVVVGWAPSGLDPGDTQASSGGGAMIHSGAEAMQWNVGASGESMRPPVTGTAGVFYACLLWAYGDDAVDSVYFTASVARWANQVGGGARTPNNNDPFWGLTAQVVRSVSGIHVFSLEAGGGAAAVRYTDDAALIALDAVTLTVTPASQANSLESGGIRVDGHDDAPQVVPVGRIGATWGDVRWGWEPRHGDTESVLFGNAIPCLLIVTGDANNFLYVTWSLADTMMLAFNAAGAGFQFANWATGGAFFVPGVRHVMRVRWWANRMSLYVDGVIRTTINAPTGFVWPIPTTAMWGTDIVGEDQVDAIYSSP